MRATSRWIGLLALLGMAGGCAGADFQSVFRTRVPAQEAAPPETTQQAATPAAAPAQAATPAAAPAPAATSAQSAASPANEVRARGTYSRAARTPAVSRAGEVAVTRTPPTAASPAATSQAATSQAASSQTAAPA